MSDAVEELWAVAQGSPHVDAAKLAQAVEDAVATQEPLDYRTRLLVRDSLAALESHWGHERYNQWLSDSAVYGEIARAADPDYFDADPHEVAFPSISRRVMDVSKPETIIEFFRTLSLHVHQPTQLTIGGSLALILRGLLSRHTEDADVVDEVPSELRNQHDVLHELAARFGLQLTHFQSHYLPTGWKTRAKPFASYGHLNVYLIDAYDVMISKLCSKRAKDLDDLRALKPKLDYALLKSRLNDSAAALLAEGRLREAAEQNWYVLFGEPLPA